MLSLKNLATNSCNSFGNQAYYEIFEVYPTASASYTFTKSATSSSVINIYEGTFNPSSPCSGFLNSSTTIANASSSAIIGNSVTESLCANQKYTIVVTSFSNSSPTLPHNFIINVTSNTSGAELKYNGPGLPTGTFYGYVIVNNTNNQIVAIVDTANMTNGAIYSTGNYTIYGLSTTSSLSSLHTTYANTNFSTFATAALNQTSNLCAELSSNVVPVTIIEPLATELITFTGNVTEKQTALVTWKVAEDDDIKYYELERSSNGTNYESIATIASKYDVDGNSINTYRFEDNEFYKAAQPLAQYRLKLITTNNKVSYSSVVSLQLAKQEELITIAPNPIENGEVIVLFNNSQKGKYEIVILNLLGNIIKQTIFNKDVTTNTMRIAVDELPAGIYFLQVSNGTKNEVIKFVKP